MILLVALTIVASGDPVANLERAVHERPHDVDVRLRLAYVLSWEGRSSESRTHAMDVVQRAPEYWDAHVLLARLDVWEQAYPRARDRLVRVLENEPMHTDAGLLLIDVDLELGKLDDAQRTLDGLLANLRTPALLYRLSALELARGNHVAARAAAAEALERDPENEPAARIQADVPLVVADLWSEVAFLPYGEVGITETLVVRALPRHYFSFTLVDELRHRFGFTDNSVRLQGDWRVTRDITLSLVGGFGAPARVVSRYTASAIVAAALTADLDAALRFQLDVLPIKARLTRGRLDVGYAIFGPLRAEAAGTIGRIDFERGAETVGFAKGDLVFVAKDIEVRGGYGYGTEVDLLLDPSNPLFAALTTPTNMPFKRLSSHSLHASGTYGFNHWFAALLGAGVQFRSDQQRTYTVRARLSFSY